MISGSVGVLLMGAGYDRFHSYSVPLGALCGAMLLSVILLTRFGPYRYGVQEENRPMEVSSGA
jgi:cyanate permease